VVKRLEQNQIQLGRKNLKCKTTASTVIATIALGSDFSEHDY